MNAEQEMSTADGLGASPLPTVVKAARDLVVGDLVKCDERYREVFHVDVRAENLESGEPTELAVSLSDKVERSRLMVVPAALSLITPAR